MHTDTIINKQEVPPLKEREVSKKADSLLTIGTKKADPNKLNNKIVKVMNLLNVCGVAIYGLSIVYKVHKAFRSRDDVWFLSYSVIDICMYMHLYMSIGHKTALH